MWGRSSKQRKAARRRRWEQDLLRRAWRDVGCWYSGYDVIDCDTRPLTEAQRAAADRLLTGMRSRVTVTGVLQ